MLYRPRTLMILAAVCVTTVAVAGWLVKVVFTRPFDAVVREADQVVLYEGLPHQNYEPDVLENERRTKPVVEFGGYPFYQQTLGLTAEDAKRLVNVLGTRGALEPFSGEKSCGGFHPDYAIEFREGARTDRILICFGCSEAKVPSGRAVRRYNLGDQSGPQLEDILLKYQNNRPTPLVGPGTFDLPDIRGPAGTRVSK